MTEKKLKKLYDDLVNDQDFDKLELELNNPHGTLFGTLLI